MAKLRGLFGKQRRAFESPLILQRKVHYAGLNVSTKIIDEQNRTGDEIAYLTQTMIYVRSFLEAERIAHKLIEGSTKISGDFQRPMVSSSSINVGGNLNEVTKHICSHGTGIITEHICLIMIHGYLQEIQVDIDRVCYWLRYLNDCKKSLNTVRSIALCIPTGSPNSVYEKIVSCIISSDRSLVTHLDFAIELNFPLEKYLEDDLKISRLIGQRLFELIPSNSEQLDNYFKKFSTVFESRPIILLILFELSTTSVKSNAKFFFSTFLPYRKHQLLQLVDGRNTLFLSILRIIIERQMPLLTQLWRLWDPKDTAATKNMLSSYIDLVIMGMSLSDGLSLISRTRMLISDADWPRCPINSTFPSRWKIQPEIMNLWLHANIELCPSEFAIYKMLYINTTIRPYYIELEAAKEIMPIIHNSSFNREEKRITDFYFNFGKIVKQYGGAYSKNDLAIILDRAMFLRVRNRYTRDVNRGPFELFTEYEQAQLTPSISTYTAILKGYQGSESFDFAKNTYDEAVENRSLIPDIEFFNALLCSIPISDTNALDSYNWIQIKINAHNIVRTSEYYDSEIKACSRFNIKNIGYFYGLIKDGKFMPNANSWNSLFKWRFKISDGGTLWDIWLLGKRNLHLWGREYCIITSNESKLRCKEYQVIEINNFMKRQQFI